MSQRPVYESEKDRQSEAKLARNVALILELKHQKLSEMLYGIDHCFYTDGKSSISGMKGDPKIWAEIKCRTYPSTRFS
ncbi:MAG: hypothetical protein ACWGQW_12645, partial [bacterium]